MAWIIDGFTKLKTFISSSLKYGSVAIVIIIPLAILMNSLGFVREQVIVLISEIVLYFAIAEVLFNALMKKYKKEKIELAEIKLKISTNQLDALQEFKKDDVQFSDAVIEQATSILASILNKKKITPELVEQAGAIAKELESENNEGVVSR
jgi:hypothetical protein